MLDEKRLAEIQRRVGRYLKEGAIVKETKGKFVPFFLNNSKNSLESAKLLFEASVNEKLKKELGLSGYNGFLWVINASYYSMFYMARALLESEGIKIKAEFSIHAMTFDALVHFFYANGKLGRRLVEDLANAGEEASAILGMEKARELMDDYLQEKIKRAKFTYELGEVALEAKAMTSLGRAKRFNEEIRKLLGE